jgi:ARG/rhodanese/phosphatase superfamily protein
VSVLVAAGARLRVPVSCVEHGRWDGARHHGPFTPAPQAAYPSLRREKNAAARASVAAGLEARADQRAVWNEIAAKSSRIDVTSAARAMHDV